MNMESEIARRMKCDPDDYIWDPFCSHLFNHHTLLLFSPLILFSMFLLHVYHWFISLLPPSSSSLFFFSSWLGMNVPSLVFLPACLSIHQTSHSRLGTSLFASQFHWTAMLYRLSVSHSFISYCVLILSSLYFYQMAKYDFRFHSILQVWRCCSRRWHTMSNLF